ncbi:MAG: lysostaphin resistance A-like protein [Halobacteriaceae archaeon]
MEAEGGRPGTTEPSTHTWARALVRAVYLGGFGYLLIAVWQVLLLDATGVTDRATAAWQVSGQLAVLLGAVTLAGGYRLTTDRDAPGLDVRVPTLRESALVVAGVLGLLAVNYGAEAVGVPFAAHSIQQYAARNPAMLGPLAVGSLLFVGPGEELLFRNVVQRTTTADLGVVPGVLVASAVFAAVHVVPYGDAAPPALAGTLGVVFVLSVVLGALYAHTRNLVVVALVHGGYDAVAFAVMYTEVAG